MLKLFEVSGYKCFNKKISLDFSDTRDYQFNTDCINNGFIGKLIIYGKNAIGKSAFSRALIDIRANTGSGFIPHDSDIYYLNADSSCTYAEFRYVFQFGIDIIEYNYRKEAQQTLIYEKITINDEILFEYDRKQAENCKVEGLRKMSPTLILKFESVKSVLSYVVSNTPLTSDNPLRKTIDFIERMTMYWNEAEGFVSQYQFESVFTDRGALLEFERFLKDSGINESLIMLMDNDGKERIYFNKSTPLPFLKTASSGTLVLFELFILYKLAEKDHDTMLILDEFDAYYHFELSEQIVKMLQKLEKTQVVFTSHNTNLLSNRFMRPDCLFVMTKNKLTSLPNSTKRELREGHNLEKLYMSGEFDE